MRLDYSIQDPHERVKYIENLLEERLYWNSRDLSKMADYIIASNKPREHNILTENRMVTINRRETSFQGLSDRLEGGEDALHSLMRSDKQMILTPKNSITEYDILHSPDLRRLRDSIKDFEKLFAESNSREKFKIKKILIEMRKEQYTIKHLASAPLYSRYLSSMKVLSSTVDDLKLDNAFHISEILNNYVRLKQSLWDDLHNDLRWTLIDLENLIEQFLRTQYPIYFDILQMKVDGATNEEIQNHLGDNWGKHHSQEYISSLWRNKIPEIIADGHRENWLNWVYTYKMPGVYKTCSRCNVTKLAHKRYFSINQAAKYGFYSVCKECRNK